MDCLNCHLDYICCSIKFTPTLNKDEVYSGFFKRNIKIVPLTENNMMLGYVCVLNKKESDGSCIYQDNKTKLCTIYENRPQSCRNFNCDERIF